MAGKFGHFFIRTFQSKFNKVPKGFDPTKNKLDNKTLDTILIYSPMSHPFPSKTIQHTYIN